MDFDRKEDFRSSFKEDRKSNEARKKYRKQAEASHGRAPGCTAVLQRPGPRKQLLDQRRTSISSLFTVLISKQSASSKFKNSLFATLSKDG